MKSQKTISQVVAFKTAADNYIAMHSAPETETKFTSVLKKMIAKQIIPIYETNNDMIAEAKLDNCLTDQVSGRILREDNGDYCYSIAGEKARNARFKEIGLMKYGIDMRLMDEELTRHMLSGYDLTVFAGFVLPEIIEED